MPKDNEVDEKVKRYSWNSHHMVQDANGPWIVYEDHAATVAKLRAEVESERKLRLRAEGLCSQWITRHDFALESLNELTADRNAQRDRADAAERRAGELKAALRDLISVADPVALAPREYERIREQTARGTCISISIDPFPLLKCRYEDVVDLTDGLKRARGTLTGAGPT